MQQLSQPHNRDSENREESMAFAMDSSLFLRTVIQDRSDDLV